MNDIRKIAIVDDHTMFRRGLCSLINLFPGYTVVLDAANGNDFIRQLNPDMLPDILLLDIAMPEMDGFALATWLKNNHPSVKVLALSTMDSDIAIIRMIKAGARGYLLKDAEPSELRRAFDDVMSPGYYYNDLVSRKLLLSSGAEVPADRLTDREQTFLKLACSEKTYYEIAKEMFVSERTVDGYRDALFKKLQVTSRVGLVLYAVKNGLILV
ncbi:response regulator [Puia sp. P3]|uniref:response regulator n=1 Tax=Puia sp. P3 TaxID=3423952 RepID=UPI003D67861D